MRKTHHYQLPLMEGFPDHQHAKELAVVSNLLDENPEVARLAMRDLVPEGVRADTGAPGMTADQTVRAAFLKQTMGFTYEELEFALLDSVTYRAFCKIGFADTPPSASTLQENIKKLRPETWEAINHVLVKKAEELGIEDGRQVRVDSTVTESNIHDPDDSAQLWDVVRVLLRLMTQAQGAGFAVKFNRRAKRARRRRLGVLNAKTQEERRAQYRDLLKVTEEVLRTAIAAAEKLERIIDPVATGFANEIRHFVELGQKVVDITRRRVIYGEKVPASEKIVSIFEPHTDIIVKDRRGVQYGHKIFLTVGVSSMVLDCVVADGNPADSDLAVKMIDRVAEVIGRVPKKAALDGGFASRKNLDDLHGKGVKDVCFSKGRGIQITEMVKSTWVYKKLWRFRAGIEGVISFLKRCIGLDRCTWRGEVGFKSYVWASVVAANLLVMARSLLG